MNHEDTIKITFVGDIFPGELPFTENYGIRTQFKKHKGKPWIERIKVILDEDDLVIGNLESPLVSESDVLKKTFFGDPEFTDFLKECGINVLNIANNHILEHGSMGLQSTIQALNEAELAIIGQISNSTSKIVYKNTKGLKIGIAGFSNVDLNIIKNNNQFAVLNEDNVFAALKEMNESKADFKILCFHWGNEYINVPSLEQRKMAHKFIDYGADVIAGHHSHVIQPYEEYKNGHIFYSLGNFIFDFVYSKMVSIGLVATLELNKNKQVHVNLRGVELSYKCGIAILPLYEFKKVFSALTKLYEEFIMLSDEEYQNRYNSLYERSRLFQRFVMKSAIFIEIIRIHKTDKIFLIKNIFTYYFDILKRVVCK
jgi:hypothetical protein